MHDLNSDMDRRGFLRALALTAAAAPLACTRNHEAQSLPNAIRKASRKDFSAAYGIVPPLITPFNEDRSVDLYALEHLVDWHVAQGVSGLFVSCGSGEIHRLEPDEVVDMARTARRAAAGRVHVLVGSTIHKPYDALDANIELTRRVADTGVDACFVIPPRQAPDSLQPMFDQIVRDYLITIHDAVACPVFAYEMPGAAFRYQFSPETVAALGNCERFIGIKDTSTRQQLPPAQGLAPVRRKLERANGSIKILQANTKYLLESWKLGCTGGINTTANVAPGLFSKLYSLWETGNISTAEALQERIREIDHLSERRYPLSAKLAVSLQGVPVKPVVRGRQRLLDRHRRRVERLVARIREVEKEFSAA